MPRTVSKPARHTLTIEVILPDYETGNIEMVRSMLFEDTVRRLEFHGIGTVVGEIRTDHRVVPS